jgi:hypothetical protein
MALANRWITSRQLGHLLGFLGQRVLGQYTIALLSAEQAPGRLLFVEENVRQTARCSGVPSIRSDLDRAPRTTRLRVRAHPQRGRTSRHGRAPATPCPGRGASQRGLPGAAAIGREPLAGRLRWAGSGPCSVSAA